MTSVCNVNLVSTCALTIPLAQKYLLARFLRYYPIIIEAAVTRFTLDKLTFSNIEI